MLRQLAPRWFLVRDVHATTKLSLLEPRWALSHLRGPMTQSRAAARPGQGTPAGGGMMAAQRCADQVYDYLRNQD